MPWVIWPADRRNYEIVLTHKGAETLANTQRAATAHDSGFLPSRGGKAATLKSLCEKLAAPTPCPKE